MRRGLEAHGVWVGLQKRGVVVGGEDFVFILRPVPDVGQENLPYARRFQRAHLRVPPVPLVEVADYAHAPRGRSPHGERRPAHSVDFADMRAQVLVDFPVVALAEKIQFVVGQRRREGIRVGGLADLPVVAFDPKAVRERLAGVFDKNFEKARRVELLHFFRDVGRLAQIDEPALCGVYDVRADDDSAPAFVHSEQVVRQTAARRCYPCEFFLRYYHTLNSPRARNASGSEIISL